MLVVVFIYHNLSSTCIFIALFDLKYMFFSKTIEHFISLRRENRSKNTVSVFPDIQKSTGKIRTPYVSSNWIEMVFIIEEKYEEMKLE